MNTSETLADRLILLRKQKGLKQKEVAEALGFTAATYNRYEKGVNMPKAGKILALAKFYNVSPNFLLFGSDDNMEEKNQQRNLQDNNQLEITPTKENLEKYSTIFDVILSDVLNSIDKGMPLYSLDTKEKIDLSVETFKKFSIEQQSEILSILIEKIVLNNDTIAVFYKY